MAPHRGNFLRGWLGRGTATFGAPKHRDLRRFVWGTLPNIVPNMYQQCPGVPYDSLHGDSLASPRRCLRTRFRPGSSWRRVSDRSDRSHWMQTLPKFLQKIMRNLTKMDQRPGAEVAGWHYRALTVPLRIRKDNDVKQLHSITLWDQIAKIPVFVSTIRVITHGTIMSIVFSTSLTLSVTALMCLDASKLAQSDVENSPRSRTTKLPEPVTWIAIHAFTLRFWLWNRSSYRRIFWVYMLRSHALPCCQTP